MNIEIDTVNIFHILGFAVNNHTIGTFNGACLCIYILYFYMYI